MTDEKKPISIVPGSRSFEYEMIGDEQPPPPPLIGGGLLHPTNTTLIYGDSGVGKGWVAAWCIRELVREGIQPAILDTEGVRYEWFTRLYGMGIRKPDDRVAWVRLDEPLTTRVAADLRYLLDSLGTQYVVIDSASMARRQVTPGDSGGMDATVSLFRAIQHLELPCCLIAHRGKDGSHSPIGSMQFMAQSRIVYRAEGEGANTILWQEKINDRPLESKPLTFTRVMMPGGHTDITRDSHRVEIETLTNAIVRMMRERQRKLTPSDVQSYLHMEGRDAALTVVVATMARLVKEGRLRKEGRGEYVFPIGEQQKTNIT